MVVGVELVTSRAVPLDVPLPTICTLADAVAGVDAAALNNYLHPHPTHW